MYIKQNDVRLFGAIASCPGCRAVLRGGENRGHTEECRDRLTKIMEEKKDARAFRANERIDQRIMEESEKIMKEQAKQEELHKRAREEGNKEGSQDKQQQQEDI